MKIIIAWVIFLMVISGIFITWLLNRLEWKELFTISVAVIALFISSYSKFLNPEVYGRAIGCLYSENVTNTLVDINGKLTSKQVDLYTIQLSLTVLNNNLNIKDIDLYLYFSSMGKPIKGELVPSIGLKINTREISIPFEEDLRTLTVLAKEKGSNYFATAAIDTSLRTGKKGPMPLEKIEIIFYDYRNKKYRLVCGIDPKKMSSQPDERYLKKIADAER